ncbi:hypothetical protein [Delftia phage PhiW-14]|uniref:Uncharacterized protein n=1 Tax=Delftia phage PhiW-14 TaxID=665032 RepID=C9DGG1_BPW14|nr:hypothetical protein DP-phiW-14_gp191 [Delftia phage PhiW-14]ACV50212.1 hypothetical protein [Delftia phage PhiW-14]
MARFEKYGEGSISIPADKHEHYKGVLEKLQEIRQLMLQHMGHMSDENFHEMGKVVVPTPLYEDITAAIYSRHEILPVHSFRSIMRNVGGRDFVEMLSENAQPPYARDDWRACYEGMEGFITCLDHEDFTKESDIDGATHKHMGHIVRAWSRTGEVWGMDNQHYQLRLRAQIVWVINMLKHELGVR